MDVLVWPARAAAFLALIFGLIAVSGCGGGFHGTEDSTSNGNQSVVSLHGDGTYDQTITCKSGRILKKSGSWEEAGPEWAAMPGVKTDGSYVVVKDEYDESTACSSKTDKPTTTNAVSPKDMYTLTDSEYKSDRDSTVAWVLVLKIAMLGLWIWAIVDVCRRDFGNANMKVGWVLCVVLLGCCGGLIYLLFGRSSGTIPSG